VLDILRAGLEALGLDPEKAPALEAFARLVLKKNEVMNLTAITAEDEFARSHLLDSAALLRVAELTGKNVVDVGTGAGFPGVPLAILCGGAELTLLDSTGKRIAFLEEACAALGLENVTCVNARAEEFALRRRERFDVAVSRAVASLPVLCELCLPLVRPGGRFIAMKSVGSDEELARSEHAVNVLGGKLAGTVDYEIPTAGVRHRAILIDKIAPTPGAYPRAFGKIKKHPL